MSTKNTWLLLIACITWGCDALYYDVSAVDPPTSVDMSQDSHIADMSPDIGPDLVDMNPIDIGPDLAEMGPPENVCEIGGNLYSRNPDVEPCDPVGQDCTVGVCEFSYNALEIRLEVRCNEPPAKEHILTLGAECFSASTEACLPGLNCWSDNTCRRSCDRRDGRGCEEGQFCVTYVEDQSTGICKDACP